MYLRKSGLMMIIVGARLDEDVFGSDEVPRTLAQKFAASVEADGFGNLLVFCVEGQNLLQLDL